MRIGKIRFSIEPGLIKNSFLLIYQVGIPDFGPVEIGIIVKVYIKFCSPIDNKIRKISFLFEMRFMVKLYRHQEMGIVEFCCAMKNDFLKVYICQKFGVIKQGVFMEIHLLKVDLMGIII